MREHASEPRDYEMMVVVTPTVAEEGLPPVIERVSGYITSQGGTVSSTIHENPWGRRRLAYQINDFPDAFYILYRFMAGPGAIEEVERDIRIDEQVIRHLIVRYDQMTEHEERQPGGPRRMGGTGTSQPSPAQDAGTTTTATPATEVGQSSESVSAIAAVDGTTPPPASDDRVEPVQPDAQAMQATAQGDTDASPEDADPGSSTDVETEPDDDEV